MKRKRVFYHLFLYWIWAVFFILDQTSQINALDDIFGVKKGEYIELTNYGN